MSSLATHILIPLFILLIFSDKLNLSKKMIIILSFFAMVPDIDIFSFHRADLHNVFSLALISICVYLITKNKKTWGISAYYLYSHAILDTFVQGVFLLYPFYNKVLNIFAGITFKNSTITPILQIEILDGLSSKLFDMAMISSENMATFVLIIIVVITVIIKNKHKSLNT